MIVKPAIGPRGHRLGPAGEVERARQEPSPGRRRPALRQGQEDDVVAPVVVALDVEVARRLGRDRQDLERDVAVDQPRDVDLATIRARQQVAAPQQRVGVQVGDPQSAVELAGAVRDVRRRRVRGRAQAGLGAGHQPPADDARPDDARGARGADRQRATDGRHERMAVTGRTARGWARDADLVEEGQRACVALERDAHEVAQRGLRLALDRRPTGGARRSPRCRDAGRP